MLITIMIIKLKNYHHHYLHQYCCFPCNFHNYFCHIITVIVGNIIMTPLLTSLAQKCYLDFYYYLYKAYFNPNKVIAVIMRLQVYSFPKYHHHNFNRYFIFIFHFVKHGESFCAVNYQLKHQLPLISNQKTMINYMKILYSHVYIITTYTFTVICLLYKVYGGRPCFQYLLQRNQVTVPKLKGNSGHTGSFSGR